MNAISFNKSDKVEIFIDRENIEKFTGRNRVDYVSLVRCVAQGRPVSNVMVFDMFRENDKDQMALYSELRELKFKIINPKGRCQNKEKQLGVDVSLAVNVVKHSIISNCDVVIIISGDGDFIPVIDEVKERGKKIEFAAFLDESNKSLMGECDYFIKLDELPFLYPQEVSE